MSANTFDPWKTYHETAAEQAAIKARAKYRDAMKEEYRRLKTNPLRPPPGVIHDPNMQRWFSARVTYAEYLRPGPKGIAVTCALFGVIGLGISLLVMRKDRYWAKVERGEVDYKTRALTYDPK